MNNHMERIFGMISKNDLSLETESQISPKKEEKADFSYMAKLLSGNGLNSLNNGMIGENLQQIIALQKR